SKPAYRAESAPAERGPRLFPLPAASWLHHRNRSTRSTTPALALLDNVSSPTPRYWYYACLALPSDLVRRQVEFPLLHLSECRSFRQIEVQGRQRDQSLPQGRNIRFVLPLVRNRVRQGPKVTPPSRVDPLFVLLTAPREAHRHHAYLALR